ncbi:MAG TPA: NAD-dependent epimerase/dehydratase family protein [Bryobacteraceae bacterium]|nr:NAD-dependent epimerase/dehydratase family protein [Bryobacteraceae bacterium]
MKGPQTEAELEDYLSRPAEADVAHAARLTGGVLILGAGGKMGPSLARLAQRSGARVTAVARFTDRELPARLQADGIETIACDMLEPGALAKLPDAPNVIFMAARKFGTAGQEHLTWAMNTFLPGLVAERYRDSNIVAFSTGNVYPLVPVESGGATETTQTAPVGEYAQSALGRERMFEYGSARRGTKAAILRLNYAVEMRYGVLADIGRAVFERRPVDVGMGFVNVIWQRDANSVAFRALLACSNPPLVLNLTGPETLSTREIALGFGRRFGVEPVFQGKEGSMALLNNASKCHELFGSPTVTPETLMDWIAEWIVRGNSQWNKPTHFEVRDGRF